MTYIPRSPRALAAAAGVLAIAGHGAAAPTLETVALSGEAAPGTEGDVVYRAFVTPRINALGDVVFNASLEGSDVVLGNDSGVWATRSSSLVIVAREGQNVPNDVGVFDRIDPAGIADSGAILFRSTRRGAGIDVNNAEGIWSTGAGDIRLVAGLGGQASDMPAGVAHTFFLPPIRDAASGGLAFQGNLTGPGVDGSNNRAIWVADPSGDVRAIAREGDRGPGTPSEVRFTGFSTPRLNGAGKAAFFASLSGPGVQSSNNSGLWIAGDAGAELFVREGDAAPGTSNTLSMLAAPLLNDAGDIAFRASLTGAGVDQTNDHGLWSNRSGMLELIARRGDAAPGVDAVIDGLPTSFSLSDTGSIGLRVTLDGDGVGTSNDAAVYVDRGGGLELLAREGDAAPGADAVFGNLRSPSLNALGFAVFTADLRGDGVDFTNNSGLWIAAPDGDVQLFLREGDTIDVGGSGDADLRTIERFNLSAGSNGDGRELGFNDAGQLALHIDFTDGSEGIFVATIPAPTTAALLCVVPATLARRRRRRTRPHAHPSTTAHHTKTLFHRGDI